jgi:hypothetical protein
MGRYLEKLYKSYGAIETAEYVEFTVSEDRLVSS